MWHTNTCVNKTTQLQLPSCVSSLNSDATVIKSFIKTETENAAQGYVQNKLPVTGEALVSVSLSRAGCMACVYVCNRVDNMPRLLRSSAQKTVEPTHDSSVPIECPTFAPATTLAMLYDTEAKDKSKVVGACFY